VRQKIDHLVLGGD